MIVSLPAYFAKNESIKDAKSIKKKPIPFASDIYSKLQNYDYPGNIRELKNMVEKASILVGHNEKNITKNVFPNQMNTAQIILKMMT